MNKLDINYLNQVIENGIKKIKRLREENKNLKSKLKSEENRRLKAIKEIEKLEKEIKERH